MQIKQLGYIIYNTSLLLVLSNPMKSLWSEEHLGSAELTKEDLYKPVYVKSLHEFTLAFKPLILISVYEA